MLLPWSECIYSTWVTTAAPISCSWHIQYIYTKNVCLISFAAKSFKIKFLSLTYNLQQQFITSFNDLPVACGLSIIQTVNWESWFRCLIQPTLSNLRPGTLSLSPSLFISLAHPPPTYLTQFSSLSHGVCGAEDDMQSRQACQTTGTWRGREERGRPQRIKVVDFRNMKCWICI